MEPRSEEDRQAARDAPCQHWVREALYQHWVHLQKDNPKPILASYIARIKRGED